MRHGLNGDIDAFERDIDHALTLIEQCPEVFRLRELWALKSHILLLRGSATSAREYADRLVQLSRNVRDARCEGWGAMLQGLSAHRLGNFAEGQALLSQGAASCEAGGDSVSVALCMSRLGFFALFWHSQ
jgi:hypothetical protein